jgi:hypothetical protein
MFSTSKRSEEGAPMAEEDMDDHISKQLELLPSKHNALTSSETCRRKHNCTLANCTSQKTILPS